MEKLQIALRKARETRSMRDARVDGLPVGAGLDGDVAAQGTPAELTASDYDLAWRALAPAEIDPAHLVRNRVVALDSVQAASPFDVLRTKIFLMMRKNGWTRLAITSPGPGCGKSTLACNLAAGFTRQPDLRTMLIELDLRRPTIAKTLGITPPHDVSSMLAGQFSFAEQALRLRDNVAIAAARRPSKDPTSLLLSRSTETALSEIETLYAPDLMIFDLPPILLGDDTRAFLKQTDCALIVARANVTTAPQIAACEQEISEHTNVLGVALNQCRHIDPDTGYGSDYGY